MVLRRITLILIACFSVSSIIAAAQDAGVNIPPKLNSSDHEHTQELTKTVLPIASLRLLPSLKIGLSGRPSPKLGLDFGFATGFCLDAACRFIVTNYHVAIGVPARKIGSQRIVKRYFATGPNDKEATLNFMPPHDPIAYATKRDLALFELRHPLPNHHGLNFSLDDLEVDQEVDLYGYPMGKINPARNLIHASARYKGPTTSGLLAFEYNLSSDKPKRMTQGASGGIVVDRKTQRIVAVLCRSNDTMGLAVPVQTLLDFVSKVQPFVAAKTFPAFRNTSPLSADLYPKFEPPLDFNSKLAPTHSGRMEHRPLEPDDVTVLRDKAQRLADSMRNFIAIQSFSWGSGDKEPQAHAEYEVRVIDGLQRFRSIPGGNKQLSEVEYPKLSDWAMGSNEWAELPKMVGAEYRLKIQRAKDAEVDGKEIRVFQYHSTVEDNLCAFQPIEDYVFFQVSKIVTVACFGEAWTDSDGNIVRISENLDLSDKLKAYKGWHKYRVVLTYGLIKIGDEPSRLAPLTIFTEGQNGKKIYWCRGNFSNYRLFASHIKILTSTQDKPQEKVPPNP